MEQPKLRIPESIGDIEVLRKSIGLAMAAVQKMKGGLLHVSSEVVSDGHFPHRPVN